MVSQLKEKLDIINMHDKISLKSLFRKSLSEQTLAIESTGNMGLIDMARKSGNKLDFRFEKINELFSYFTLAVKIEDRLN
jgi:hypothetical protein